MFSVINIRNSYFPLGRLPPRLIFVSFVEAFNRFSFVECCYYKQICRKQIFLQNRRGLFTSLLAGTTTLDKKNSFTPFKMIKLENPKCYIFKITDSDESNKYNDYFIWNFFHKRDMSLTLLNSYIYKKKSVKYGIIRDVFKWSNTSQSIRQWGSTTKNI